MKNLLLLSYFLLMMLPALLAQSTETDWQIRSGLAVEYQPGSKWRWHYEQEFRFEDNISEFTTTFSEVGVKYLGWKPVALRPSVRYYVNPDAPDRFRFQLDAEAEQELGDSDVEAGLRLRFQHENELDPEVEEQETDLRAKFNLVYEPLKKFALVLENEYFFQLDGVNEFTAFRITGGIEWELLPKIELEMYYRHEQSIDRPVKSIERMFGFFLTYKLWPARKEGDPPRDFGHPYRY